MNLDEYNKIIHDIKTSVKFARIATTMLRNTGCDIIRNNENSEVGINLTNISASLSDTFDNFETNIEKFKHELKYPGCQLSIFDYINDDKK